MTSELASSVRIGRWMLHHRTLGGWLHAARHRSRWWQTKSAQRGCYLCRSVWAEALSRSSFKEALDRGLADLAANRTYKWDHGKGPGTPSALWSPDDPIQPDGWHHDGEQWVRDA